MQEYHNERPKFLVLEPRIMFDGAMAADSVEVAMDADDDHAEPVVENIGTDAEPSRQIIFVDEGVRDHSSLIDSLQTDAEVFILKSSENGLQQIATALRGRSDVAGIHVFSHGGEAQLRLGDLVVTTDNLSENKVALEEIGQALSEDGDILLYGCNVATDNGQEFITSIAALTRADVAASDDLTGAGALGGDWDLEGQIGSIEAEVLSANTYQGILGTPSISNQTDTKIGVLAPAQIIDTDVTFVNGTDYTGGYVDFSLASITTFDTLALTNADDVNASGAISIVGSVVYQGTGAGREIIGAVDSVLDGTGGNNLRINLTSAITNTSFETNLDGWTLTNAVYPTNLNGTTIDFVYNGGGAGGNTAGTGTGTINSNGGGYTGGSTTLSSAFASDGSNSMKVSLTGSVTTTGVLQKDGNNSVHGTYATSNIFYANAGGTLAVDWSAVGGGDDYEVFGFLLGAGTDGVFDTGDDTTTTLFSQRGDQTVGFTTETSTFATTGLYKFQFLSGSYDGSGGGVTGADLYIDNLVLTTTPPVINDTTISNLANLISFQNTETNPSSTPRTLTWSARANDGSIGSATSTITISDAVDPVPNSPPPIVDEGLVASEPVLVPADDKTSDGLRTIVRAGGLGDSGRDGLRTIVRSEPTSVSGLTGDRQEPVRGLEPASDVASSADINAFRPVVAGNAAGGLPPGQFIGVMRGIADVSTSSNGAVSFTVPSDAFAVSNPASVVELTAAFPNGEALPAWLNFDATTGQFSGVAPPNVEGEFEVSVFASDQDGNWVETRFKLFVGGDGVAAEDAETTGAEEQPVPAGEPNQNSQVAPVSGTSFGDANRFTPRPGFTTLLAQNSRAGTDLSHAALVEIARLATERSLAK